MESTPQAECQSKGPVSAVCLRQAGCEVYASVPGLMPEQGRGSVTPLAEG